MVPVSEVVFQRYLQILYFPVNNPEYVPSLIPLFVGLIVLEVYFGKYKYEHLGWNSAVSNSTLLITTGLTLIYKLNLLETTSGPRFKAAYGILILGTIILFLNFYHLWPEEIAFNMSSAFLSYTSVYVAIAIVYEELTLNQPTFIAAGGVLASFFLFFHLVKSIEKTVVPARLRAGPE